MEVPQLLSSDKVVDIPVVAQRQIPMVQSVQKTIEIPQLQYIAKVVDVPGVPVVQILRYRCGGRQSSPTVAAAEKSVEIPHVFLDKVVDMPVIVNDRVLHSGGASIQFIACFRGHSSCATQTGTMLPAFFLMAAMMGFLTHFASFFALLRLCRS